MDQVSQPPAMALNASLPVAGKDWSKLMAAIDARDMPTLICQAPRDMGRGRQAHDRSERRRETGRRRWHCSNLIAHCELSLLSLCI